MSDSPFWNEEWMKIQQEYWENWTEMSCKAMGLEQPDKSPLESAMDHWWQGVAPGATDFNREFIDKMMDQSKSFFRLGESYYRNAAESNSWLDAANRTVADLQQIFSSSMEHLFNGAEATGDDALHKMMAFWEMPMENWQRMVSSLSPALGELLSSDSIQRIMSVPGLGFMREEEGQYKQLMQRVVEYRRALVDYMRFFSNLGLLSANRLSDKVQELVEEGRQIDTARGLFDLWVCSSEEVYAEQVMTPEYIKIHGRMVNALMAVKQTLNHLADKSQGALNMLTRHELRTLQDRLQASRREIKSLGVEMELMKEQIMELRKSSEVKTNAAAQAATPVSKAVKKKASKKKRAATKRGDS